jgi:haloacetate dehalogenase
VLEGFERLSIETTGATINVLRAGSGPPVLLLHGWPQTLVQWHLVAPRLAERFTVVLADLRGHGDSSKPAGGERQAAYAKREHALDQVEVMAALGFDRFALVGHDRGARVAHRLALDHADRVVRLVLLDVAPTLFVVESTSHAGAWANYHWYFLTQPYDLPERLIGADPDYFLRWTLRSWSGGDDSFLDERAVAEYARCFRDPATIHATCEDIRALVGVDLEHDRADREANRLVECPLLVVWGTRWRSADLLSPWRDHARNVQGRPLDAGHWLAEERPTELSAELLGFLS